MARTLAAVALICALASPAMAASRRVHRPACVAVAIEGIPSLVCARPARRR